MPGDDRVAAPESRAVGELGVHDEIALVLRRNETAGHPVGDVGCGVKQPCEDQQHADARLVLANPGFLRMYGFPARLVIEGLYGYVDAEALAKCNGEKNAPLARR